MKVDVVLGLQWGDEGKGKIVDFLSPKYDVVARFQGGPNAGHSLHFEGKSYVLHSIPSGIFHSDKANIIGNGVVLDPITFRSEIVALLNEYPYIKNNLYISRKTHLILPTHRVLDAASEASKGKTKIGSTLKGIGPTYMDKTGRNGLRVGDTLTKQFKDKYHSLVKKHKRLISNYDFDYDIAEKEKEWFDAVEFMHQFQIVDSEFLINKYISDKKLILAEGAQGTLLDIDFGTYPYVTSSSTVSAGACIGLGIAPNKLGDIYGIFKSYTTRVGSGPFPTELFDEDGTKLQNLGNEIGATTGRARRCGWLDLVALKYTVLINGITKLILTKADILTGFDTIKLAVAYKINGEETTEFPYDIEQDIEPIYKEFPSWKFDKDIKSYEKMPLEFKNYVRFIEDFVGAPVNIISVGPDRSETIFRS